MSAAKRRARAVAPSSKRGGSQLPLPAWLTHPWTLTTAALLFMNYCWQWHGIDREAFQNQDVSGIVYNAKLLLSGGTPYIDSAELKPPGAFLIIAPALAWGGLKGVWMFSVLWGTGTSLATGWLAHGCFGKRFAIPVALFHAAGAPIPAAGDINYTFWMTMPFTLAAAAGVAGWHAETDRRRLQMWTIAGAAAMVSVLVKPTGAMLLLPFGACFVGELWRRQARAAGLIVAGGVLGAVAAFAVVTSPFWATGRSYALIDGYMSTRSFGTEYIDVVVKGSGGWINAIRKGAKCLPKQCPWAYRCFIVALVPMFGLSAARDKGTPWFFLGAFFVASFLGIGMTLRFYIHDSAQLWPAVALVTMRPGGIFGAFYDYVRPKLVLSPAIPVQFGLLLTGADYVPLWLLERHLHNTDDVVRDACRDYGDRLPPDEPVLAWGWNAWSVYYHCDRRAPGRIYKSLALVTTVNTNTCNARFEDIYVRPGPMSEQFMADLHARPPSMLMWSDYYRHGTDLMERWEPLHDFVEQNYVFVGEQRGPLRVFLRSDLAQDLPSRSPFWKDPEKIVKGRKRMPAFKPE